MCNSISDPRRLDSIWLPGNGTQRRISLGRFSAWSRGNGFMFSLIFFRFLSGFGTFVAFMLLFFMFDCLWVCLCACFWLFEAVVTAATYGFIRCDWSAFEGETCSLYSQSEYPKARRGWTERYPTWRKKRRRERGGQAASVAHPHPPTPDTAPSVALSSAGAPLCPHAATCTPNTRRHFVNWRRDVRLVVQMLHPGSSC